MGSDAAHYTYGFHHGQRSRLALRIIPISYVRANAATGSRQNGIITSYVSIHPIPDMGPHTAEIVEVQGSDPLAITRVMSQIPNNRSGKMNIIIPYIQAKLNATLLLLHRFLYRWLGGRQVFLMLNRVPVNYGINNRRLNTDAETVIKIQVRRERISSFGRSSYNTNVANMAELRRLIGFTNQIQQRTVAMQSELLELLDPGLLDAMHGTPMLLPHSVHQHSRPFWIISNLEAETDIAQLIELLHRYDIGSEGRSHCARQRSPSADPPDDSYHCQHPSQPNATAASKSHGDPPPCTGPYKRVPATPSSRRHHAQPCTIVSLHRTYRSLAHCRHLRSQRGWLPRGGHPNPSIHHPASLPSQPSGIYGSQRQRFHSWGPGDCAL
jgi:hypothetical protein